MDIYLGQFPQKRRTRVFLSYANADKRFAKKIANQLEISGIDVWFAERELLPGDSIVDKIGKELSSSDYFFLLLSKNSLRYKWFGPEFSKTYLEELTTRNVVTIPVIIDDSEIPDFLSGLQIFDLKKRTEKNIRKLVDQITRAPRIDFSYFSWNEFQELAVDLLKKLDFTEIQADHGPADRGFDLIAEYTRKDPFGVEKKEIWVVETKFYQTERASLRALRQLISSLAAYPDAKALLVTNGLLTSTAKKWLKDVQQTGRRYVRVIEGPELRNLLLRFPDLVDRYFPQSD